MSDPRNVAHDKKVTEEKKHHGVTAAEDAPAVQPGKKAAATRKKQDPASIAADPDAPAAGQNDEAGAAAAAAATPAALEASLVVLGQLKELEFHSRAALERLATLGLTVDDELKQKAFVEPLSDVYSAQNAFQTKLTALIEAYKAETDRMRGTAS